MHRSRNKTLPTLIGVPLLLMAVCCKVSSVAGLFGEVVDDETTDRLFENMGQAEVTAFSIIDGVVNFAVTVEDRQGKDEFWVIDFQPFEYFGTSAINSSTGFLSINGTGTCSNVKDNVPLSEGFFKDEFFESGNETGSKDLFNVYQRGRYDENGTRIDMMSYEGSMGTFLDCRRSDGSSVWQYVIRTADITYTTVMYATNVRPLPAVNNNLDSIIAYVQTNVKLAWTLSRIAITNFVIASQSAYTPRMVIMVGRVKVEFDFAIVEPYVTEDGTVDPSRAHLELGISTLTPISNTSLLVFMGEDFMYYEAEMAGNVMTEILRSPPTTIEETPGCIFNRQGYCRQRWEFEFILEMNMTLLSEEKPLDASGVFEFQFDAYLCEDLIPNEGCIQHDLPPWNISADVTLQTVIDIIDEDMDVVSVTVVSMTNDKGEDLQGGSKVSHMENVTLEVTFSPAFLRDRYVLELDLFMVCMGEDHSESTRGCLGAETTERYTAFLEDDFEMEYYAMEDPAYLKTITTVQTFDLAVTTNTTTEPPRYVSVVPTKLFMLMPDNDGRSSSTFLMSDDQVLPSNTDQLAGSAYFQTIELPWEALDDEKFMVIIGSSIAAIMDEASLEDITNDFDLHDDIAIYGSVWDAVSSKEKLPSTVELYSAYLKLPVGGLSYFGFDDPLYIPCSEFPELVHHWEHAQLDLLEFAPNLTVDDLSSLREIGLLYETFTSLHAAAQEHRRSFLAKESFMHRNIWHDAVNQVEDLIAVTEEVSRLLLDVMWDTPGDDSQLILQDLTRSLILFKPLISTRLISQNFSDILTSLDHWVSQEGFVFNDLMAAAVRESVVDGSRQSGESPTLVALFQPLISVLPTVFYDKDDFEEALPRLVFKEGLDLDMEETFYDLLFNLTLGIDGKMNSIYYISKLRLDENFVTSRNLSGDALGYEILGCTVDWDYTSSVRVFKEPEVISGMTLAGGWNHWSEWSSCSTSCQGGTQSRARHCLDPEEPCSGGAVETRACNELPCGLFTDGNDLVHDVIMSTEVMTLQEMSAFCQRMQATLIKYPHANKQDAYVLQRMKYAKLDSVWIFSKSSSDCSILSYNGDVIPVKCNSLFHGFCIKDFVVVFEAFARNGESIRNAWYSLSKDESHDRSDRRSHFIDGNLVNAWNKDIDIKEIKLAVYDNDQLVMDLHFDGSDTDPRSWFKASHLKSAWPYSDLVSEEASRNFQLYGPRDKSQKLLSVDKNIGKCTEMSGWLIVVDGEKEFACDWEVSRAYPLILYSTESSASNWNLQTVGRATKLAIFIQYYMRAPTIYQPAVTHPVPIVYNSDMIGHPLEWQKLNHEIYDVDKQVHRTSFTNFAMSADSATYTMTAAYSVIEKPDRRKRRHLQPRKRRNIWKSLKYPKMKSLPFTFVGCPNQSSFNPSSFTCDCTAPLAVYDLDSFACEPTAELRTESTTTSVACIFSPLPFCSMWLCLFISGCINLCSLL